MRSGIRYARRAPELQAILARTLLFFLFSSALLALLPLIGRRALKLDPSHYGLLLGSMGAGAVIAAVLLRRVATQASPDRLALGATVALSGAMLALAHAPGLPSAAACMAVAGAAWITTLSVLNGAAQRAAPAWVRARSLALYLVVFQGGMAGGSILWGTLASHFGVATAITIAALGLLVTLPLTRVFPLPAEADLEPSMDWPPPIAAGKPSGDRGPVMVTVEYRIDPASTRAFALAMRDMERLRRRDGAFAWLLVEDTAQPGLMLETFLVSSWLDHLRQHERHTHADVPLQETVRRFHVGDAPPGVRHLIAPSLPIARHAAGSSPGALSSDQEE
jgi:MFS family permease